MEKLMKIADITASSPERLEQIVDIFTKSGFFIVYDEEYECTAYVCEVVSSR